MANYNDKNDYNISLSNDNNANNKQIFHAFLFNIRNYSPGVINIQGRKAELNVILPR